MGRDAAPVRVVMVTPFYAPFDDQATAMAHAVLEADVYEVTVVTTPCDTAWKRLSGQPPVETDGRLIVDRRAGSGVPADVSGGVGRMLLDEDVISEAVRSTRPDVIHLLGRQWVAAHSVAVTAKWMNTAVVWTPGAVMLQPSRAEQWLAARCDAVTFATEAEGEALQEAFELKTARMRRLTDNDFDSLIDVYEHALRRELPRPVTD